MKALPGHRKIGRGACRSTGVDGVGTPVHSSGTRFTLANPVQYSTPGYIVLSLPLCLALPVAARSASCAAPHTPVRAPRHFCSSAATGTAAGLPAAKVELRRELWSDRTWSRLARRARPSSGVLGGITGVAGQPRRCADADGLPRARGDMSDGGGGGGGGGGASASATVAAAAAGGGGEVTLSRGRAETEWRERVAGDMAAPG